MGVRILEGTMDGGEVRAAVLYCSTTMTAFGPLFDDAEEAEAFLAWAVTLPAREQYALGLPGDVRLWDDAVLEARVAAFRRERDGRYDGLGVAR